MPPRIWKVRYLRLVRRVQRLVRHPRLRHRLWWKPVLERMIDRRMWQPCRDSVAGGMAIGLFFAMMFMPGQMIAAALAAIGARVNVPFAVAACWVTNPFTSPFIRLSQLKFGHWLRDTLGVPMISLGQVDFRLGEKTIPLDVSDFILGFLASGLLLGLLIYPLVHVFSAVLPQILPISKPRLSRGRASRQSDANRSSLRRTAPPGAYPR